MKLINFACSNIQSITHGEGSKIPWNDPQFSKRMLENHLSQDHDWASRRKDIIARHTTWITKQLPKASHILDMGCGPGLYTYALAQQGHTCIGVDFSPASIEYATEQATSSGLDAHYVLSDIRTYTSEQPFDCIIMTFGEFNVFSRKDATAILHNCGHMLSKNGLFILEAHTPEAIRAIGETPATWQRHTHGLFSDVPHLCLQENSWDAAAATALATYSIIDADSAQVTQYSSHMQAYTNNEYREMLFAAGLHLQQILSVEEWPTGQDFTGKLQTFICRNS